jgi:hypothetical protein
MKRVLFGSAAAILAVAGLSSYKQSTTYYFKVSSSLLKGHSIHLDNAEGTAISGTNTSTVATTSTAWGLPACSGTGDLCIVTVSSSNIITTAMGGKRFLKTKNIAGSNTTVAYNATFSTKS